MVFDLSAQLLGRDAPVPPALRGLAERLAPGARLTPLWRNDLAGFTLLLEQSGQPSRVLKWSPPGREVSVPAERERLEWAIAFHPVPRVLDSGAEPLPEGEHAQWLLTEHLPGETAVAERWRAEPRRAVRAIGEGLRRLHDTLPVEGCPFAGPALEGSAPDRLVVAHGDACAPNTLLDATGAFLAHVDLGALGVADRWSDLAIASLSLDWNFGPGWQAEFFAAYGIAPDAERIRLWRERWNAHDGESALGEPGESAPSPIPPPL